MRYYIDNSTTLGKEVQAEITPEIALEILKRGNERFIENLKLSRNLSQQVVETSAGQFPFAAILSCIDSRVPAELVFDQGIGDIFNVRVAGNFVNEDILGSLEFACKVAGAKAIVVLGHSQCGAVKGACDDVKLGHLSQMLENIKPAVNAVNGIEGERSSANPEFVQKVAEKNVQLAMDEILNRSEILREMAENNQITVSGGMYCVNSGKVNFL